MHDPLLPQASDDKPTSPLDTQLPGSGQAPSAKTTQTGQPRANQYMTRRNIEGFEYKPNPWKDVKAWLISSVFHTLAFLCLAFLWQPVRRGSGDLLDRPVGIAVFHATQKGERYELSDNSQGSNQKAPSEQNLEANSPASESNSSAAPPIDLSELTKDLIGNSADSIAIGSALGKVGQGLSGTGDKQGNSGDGPGGATTATFMGLKGSGSNFVYVLDRSASMEEFQGAPIRFAKSELLKSISSLGQRNQFQIVFYNESPGSLSNGSAAGKLLAANEINKEKAIRFIKAIKPSGGTEHIPGLKMGLSFSPDVLFFLTDAAEPSLTESQLIDIQNRAERSLTTIHTIQFNHGPAPNDGTWIRELAERNRGTYRYIDISNLE